MPMCITLKQTACRCPTVGGRPQRHTGGGGLALKAARGSRRRLPPKHLDTFKGAPRRLPKPLSDQFLG